MKQQYKTAFGHRFLKVASTICDFEIYKDSSGYVKVIDGKDTLTYHAGGTHKQRIKAMLKETKTLRDKARKIEEAALFMQQFKYES